MILIDFNSEATKKEIVQTLRRCACWLRNSACEFGLGRIFESICNRSRRLSYPILFSLIICIRHSTLLSFCCAILWPVMMSGTTTSLASEVQRMNKHNFLCVGVSVYSKSIFEMVSATSLWFHHRLEQGQVCLSAYSYHSPASTKWAQRW